MLSRDMKMSDSLTSNTVRRVDPAASVKHQPQRDDVSKFMFHVPQLPSSAGDRPFAPSIDPAMLRQQEIDERVARAIDAGIVAEETDVVSDALGQSSADASVEQVANWETPKAGAKKKKVKDSVAATCGEGINVDDNGIAGLENRYGENNCYLNVVAQTLFRVQVSTRCH